MENLKKQWDNTYDKKNPKHYSDKGYRAYIIGLTIGIIVGAAAVAFLLISYSFFFRSWS